MKALTKGLDLLAVFADRPRCRFEELATRTRIPRSSLYRFLAVLESRGFLRQDRATREFFTGPLVYRLGNHGNGLDHMRHAVLSEMPRVVERVGESAYLYVREGVNRVCVEVVETEVAPIKHFIKAGSSFPLYAGASGKAILAFLPEIERARILKEMTPKKLGPGAPTDRRSLQRELERVSRRGYAYSEEEVSPGAWALAVPLRDSSGHCIASLGVAGPLFRLNRDRIDEYARFLRGVVGRIQKTAWESV